VHWNCDPRLHGVDKLRRLAWGHYVHAGDRHKHHIGLDLPKLRHEVAVPRVEYLDALQLYQVGHPPVLPWVEHNPTRRVSVLVYIVGRIRRHLYISHGLHFAGRNLHDVLHRLSNTLPSHLRSHNHSRRLCHPLYRGRIAVVKMLMRDQHNICLRLPDLYLVGVYVENDAPTHNPKCVVAKPVNLHTTKPIRHMKKGGEKKIFFYFFLPSNLYTFTPVYGDLATANIIGPRAVCFSITS
jgi:hypothetical protein